MCDGQPEDSRRLAPDDRRAADGTFQDCTRRRHPCGGRRQTEEDEPHGRGRSLAEISGAQGGRQGGRRPQGRRQIQKAGRVKKAGRLQTAGRIRPFVGGAEGEDGQNETTRGEPGCGRPPEADGRLVAHIGHGTQAGLDADPALASDSDTSTGRSRDAPASGGPR
jgi:hypothetical protein